jgi:hypothetical protein
MKIQLTYCLIVCLSLLNIASAQSLTDTSKSPAPRIVNIVNFIRLLEPRDSSITEEVLYETVVKQVAMLKQYHLKGTFLLQYDAMMDSRYQKLLRSLQKDEFEIGAWWEIPQPLVEHAGLQWRGRYPWDWRANIGFSTGYSQDERIKLIDTYMTDFKKIFGDYPKTVSSWFIDAFSLNYMYEKYHIVASGNCKDQYGTDGYTLWGGYWNQAYYPSKINAYMPAQNISKQIPVPIFRMLGSDPVRQYDNGLGNERQGVVTLEPVYSFGGGDSAWVHWFFQQMIDGESLAFAYTQAGQENSFTWKAMQRGFEIQMPLIAHLRDENKIVVETLGESGKWFSDHYKVTPPTAVTVNKDLGESNKKTVWYDSRFYRINFLWEDVGLRIRDIHLFNENFPSVYETKPVTENECKFFTLPFVDGYLWSKDDTLAGLRFKANIDGKEILLKGENVSVKKNANGDLQIIWQLQSVPGKFIIDCNERNFTISLESASSLNWHLDFTAAANAQLPFKKIQSKNIQCSFEDFKYNVLVNEGTFTKADNTIFSIQPTNNKIILKLDEER